MTAEASIFDPAHKRAPIVTDDNRQWAIDQKPKGWDDEAPQLPWEQHVAEQAERFERHFCEDRKPKAEWSGLWRRVWWPKADPAVLHPKQAPQIQHPFIRIGHARWAMALQAMSPIERKIAEKCGVAQFNRNDPRAAILVGDRDD